MATFIKSTTVNMFEEARASLDYLPMLNPYSISLFPESTSNATFSMTSSAGVVRRELRFVCSYSESVVLLIYLYIAGLMSVILNLLVIASIVRNPRLHNPESVVILSDSINNVIFVVAFHTFALIVLQTDFSPPNYYVCQIFGTMSSVTFLTTPQLLMIYAYERYLFFCDPIKHTRHVTKRRVVVLLLIVVSLSYGWNIFLSLPDRVMTYTAMVCLSRYQQRSAAINFVLYGVPAVSMAAFSVINIKRLYCR
jgi:hypothetical protein